MKMNYFVFGTNNRNKAEQFYDGLFESLNIKKRDSGERMTVYIGDGFLFALADPFNGEAATAGNGTQLGFNLDSAEQVSEIYQLGLQLGGTSEGEDKPRSGHFSAYLRDLDGNKICLWV